MFSMSNRKFTGIAQLEIGKIRIMYCLYWYIVFIGSYIYNAKKKQKNNLHVNL